MQRLSLRSTLFHGRRTACAILAIAGLVSTDVAVAERLVSRGVPVTASRQHLAYYTLHAVDSNYETMWNSGQFSPAWIELDLGVAVPVSKVRLLVRQTPDGATHHILYGGLTPNPTNPLVSFYDVTYRGAWLTYIPATADPDVRYLRVETIGSPSWVAWEEIEVYTPN
jgi:hypothetical protein